MNIAKLIDHTLLAADASHKQIVDLCSEAVEYGFATVCVNPGWVKTASEELADTGVGITTVIGFPLGATTTSTKLAELLEAKRNGATEVDMVVNVGRVKSGLWQEVSDEIRLLVNAAHSAEVSEPVILKVIIETALLTDAEKARLARIVSDSGADFIKTSTGFAKSGATVEDVILLKANVDAKVQVKASGGVRDYKTAEAMIAAGASRLGTSNGIIIVEESLGHVVNNEAEGY